MNTQPIQRSLFTPSEPIRKFDGKTYNKERDETRLTGQLGKVFAAMKDGKWHSLSWLAQMAEGSESGVSARLRDLRKDKFGKHTVERQNIDSGYWMYRLIVRK